MVGVMTTIIHDQGRKRLLCSLTTSVSGITSLLSSILSISIIRSEIQFGSRMRMLPLRKNIFQSVEIF
jgi:hypothetical protein